MCFLIIYRHSVGMSIFLSIINEILVQGKKIIFNILSIFVLSMLQTLVPI